MKKYEIGLMVKYHHPCEKDTGNRYYITFRGTGFITPLQMISREDAKVLIEEAGLLFTSYTREHGRISAAFFACPENSAKYGYRSDPK